MPLQIGSLYARRMTAAHHNCYFESVRHDFPQLDYKRNKSLAAAPPIADLDLGSSLFVSIPRACATSHPCDVAGPFISPFNMLDVSIVSIADCRGVAIKCLQAIQGSNLQKQAVRCNTRERHVICDRPCTLRSPKRNCGLSSALPAITFLTTKR